MTDAMFHTIRKSGTSSTAVLVRMVEVPTAVLGCERDPARITVLQRHADLVLHDAECGIGTPADLRDVRARRSRFVRVREDGPLALVVS